MRYDVTITLTWCGEATDEEDARSKAIEEASESDWSNLDADYYIEECPNASE